ncbi:phosphoribosyltransferase family protein (plasmid) [Deinococcus sp. KNUC1210]|uniref:phosphoribosyltransferase domain-containing protein n=1 Tax=Deinococcus sp. KNUC1210 TaxID=2917691 RepID=UPI001EF1526E|nr:phosphoribosyltransferase domain-containing protein [Deinococcus sp. KNUC1210]ULH17305.1 phosphoribosyltransferase family protein [Deinococcus sp. KNUC1210]
MPSPPAPAALDVCLPSGTLHLTLDQASAPLDDLLTYAVRRNPRRGFLFVSRVLGKHIPVSPDVAARSYHDLAAALPTLHAPHFIGLAETATALGEGVFRAWQAQQRTERGTFQHTTRYAVTGRSVLLRFDEPHSHAPAHLLYDPGETARRAEELVLIDDELSTGTTLEHLTRAWTDLHPHVRRVVLVSLTDWCGRRQELAAALGLPLDFVSLSRGTYTFTPDPGWTPAALPSVVGNGANKAALLPALSPRYGQPSEVPTPGELGLDLTPEDRVLVLGSGEFQYPAFLLAQSLAPLAAACHFSATTRSPVLPGLGIAQHLSFTDSVGDGIPNYLYNVDPARYTRILVTFEGNCTPDPVLMAALGPHAQAIRLSPPLDPR